MLKYKVAEPCNLITKEAMDSCQRLMRCQAKLCFQSGHAVSPYHGLMLTNAINAESTCKDGIAETATALCLSLRLSQTGVGAKKSTASDGKVARDNS